MWQSRTSKRRGASLLSYGLVVGLISVVALSAVTTVGSSSNELFSEVGTTLDDVISSSAGQSSGEPAPTPDGIPADCAAVLSSNPSATDGVYQIDPDGDDTGTDVWCDMTTSGGGWTRILYTQRDHQDDYNLWTAADYTFETHGTVDSSDSWSVVMGDLNMGTIMMACANGNTSSVSGILTESGSSLLVDYLQGQRARTGVPDTFGNNFDTNLGLRADLSSNAEVWYLQDNFEDDLGYDRGGVAYGYETAAYNVAQCLGTTISATNALIVQVR